MDVRLDVVNMEVADVDLRKESAVVDLDVDGNVDITLVALIKHLQLHW